jgi:hypothetical protein
MKTCSISADFMNSNADILVPQGMTEANLSGAQAKGQWGVVCAKAAKGEIQMYSKVAHGTKPDGTTFSVTYTGLSKYDKTLATFDVLKIKGSKHNTFSASKNSAFMQQVLDEATWKFGNATKPTVAGGSKSVGAMSDEDVSALFVTVKDQLAKDKGINIKGANPQLDSLVYKEIGDAIGYTPAEVAAKIDAYKATGKKLSALKKKVAKNPPSLPKKPPTVPVPDEHGNVILDSPKKTPSTKPPEAPVPDPEAVKVFKEMLDAPDVTAEDIEYIKKKANKGLTPKVKLAAQKALDDYEIDWKDAPPKAKSNWHKDPTFNQAVYDQWQSVVDKGDPDNIAWMKAVVVDDPDYVHAATIKAVLEDNDLTWGDAPNGVQTAATQELAEEVSEAVGGKGLSHAYTDEDLAAQYIIAKDYVVGESNGKWTLYTQKNVEMDDAIFDAIKQVTGKTRAEVEKGISGYLASGKKLSSLKKALIKQGTLKPKAPTLKGGTAATKSNVNALASKGFNPEGFKPKKLTAQDDDKIYQSFKTNGLPNYIDSPQASLLSNLDKIKEGFAKPPYNMQLEYLDILRAIDRAGAKKFGVDNGFLFEKRMVEWAASPEGKAHFLKKIEADKLEALKPALPKDSAAFEVFPYNEALAMANRLPPLSQGQKSALRTYTGSAYHSMNNALRNGGTITQTIKDAIAGMRATDKQFLVHRGCDFKQFKEYGINSYEDLIAMTGKTVHDKGFLSTSVGGSSAFSGTVKMEIEVVKGTKAAFVDHFSAHRGENEFIIAPGTKMKILRVDKVGYQTVVRLRVIL